MHNLGPMPTDDGTMAGLDAIRRWLNASAGRCRYAERVHPGRLRAKEREDIGAHLVWCATVMRAVLVLLRARPMGNGMRLIVTGRGVGEVVSPPFQVD